MGKSELSLTFLVSDRLGPSGEELAMGSRLQSNEDRTNRRRLDL